MLFRNFPLHLKTQCPAVAPQPSLCCSPWAPIHPSHSLFQMAMWLTPLYHSGFNSDVPLIMETFLELNLNSHSPVHPLFSLGHLLLSVIILFANLTIPQYVHYLSNI